MTVDARKGNTPDACHEGISDTEELRARYPRRRDLQPCLRVGAQHRPTRDLPGRGRDDDHAWALYRWNLDLAATFTALSCDVEVTLRNTIHDRLTSHFGRDDWWASTDLVLDDITSETLTEVVRRHRKQLAKGTIGAGKVVADLMLGTWVMLLGRGGTSALGRAIDYEANLWRPALRFGFATGSLTPSGRVRRPTRDAVHQRASNLQRLRNRAAHHEPIFDGIWLAGTKDRIDLLTVWEQAVELLGWMNPDLAGVHRATPTLPHVFAARPS